MCVILRRAYFGRTESFSFVHHIDRKDPIATRTKSMAMVAWKRIFLQLYNPDLQRQIGSIGNTKKFVAAVVQSECDR